MTYQELKKIGNLWTTGDGKVGIRPYKKLTKKQENEIIIYIKQNKLDIIKQINDEEQESEARQKAEEEAAKYIISVYLSSRGWGDYSPVTVDIDTRKPEAEWIAEARHALDREHDVDEKNMTDDDILSKINAVIKERDEKAARKLQREQKNKEREERRTLYTVTTHKTVQAWGDEERGDDGFWDATVTDSAGYSTRVIIRNVFDFGYYGYPQRFSGTENALLEDKWTQTERDAVKWALEFSPIDHNMRM